MSFLSESTTSNEPEDGTEYLTYIEKSNVITGRNIIIFTGSLISVALVIVILWEIYKYRILKTPSPVFHSPDVIYDDIAL